jgi:15-cis-phytoene synthase
VLRLAPPVQRAWLDRIRWIRCVDRLAENERFEPSAHRFATFIDAWKRLLAHGIVDWSGPFARELSDIRRLWFLHEDVEADRESGSATDEGDTGAARTPTEESMALLSIGAWDAYLAALADYHAPNLIVHTLKEHDTMLWRLSGRIFQLVPFLTKEMWDAAGEFGRLDQFFNNLRDMQEDSDRGICYLPDEVLARFGVTHGQILSGSSIGTPGYTRLMRFWLDEHLPTLFARATTFIDATALHPSLKLMKEWSLRRYERIARVFRATEFDYRRFPARYWAEVRRDLAVHRLPTWSQPV